VKDLAIVLADRPGALAEMAETLGHAGVNLEGGGAFAAGGVGVAHFLVADAAAARTALELAGIEVAAVSEVVVQRLRQGEPGQLGKLARRMAEAGVDIRAQYSDHDQRLILVVDDLERGRQVAAQWASDGGYP
jgi:hypothetical protein